MLLKLIIALLVFTVAKQRRCPARPPIVGMKCTLPWYLTCKYRNRCFCYGKFRKVNYYRCGRFKRRWGVKRLSRRCHKCPPGCGCEKVTSAISNIPVCSLDGKTFSNMCKMFCARKRLGCRGVCPCENECQTNCDLTASLAIVPHCGTNGKTYPNLCYLKCAKTNIACTRKCPCGRKVVQKTKRKRIKKTITWKRWRVIVLKTNLLLVSVLFTFDLY